MGFRSVFYICPCENAVVKYDVEFYIRLKTDVDAMQSLTCRTM